MDICIEIIDFMHKSKDVTDLTNLFSPNIFKYNHKTILKYIKMDEVPNMYPDLIDKTQFRLKTKNKIKDYFIAEIGERELISKGISKYIAAFDYFDKVFIVLFATSCGVSIALFASIIGAHVGIASPSFSFAFYLTSEIIKQLFKITRNKKKKT